MNSSTTRWLLLVALALAVFIAVYERRLPSTAQIDTQAGLVFPDLVPGEVTALDLVKGTNCVFRVVRTNDQWIYAAPFTDGAQGDPIGALLKGLAELRAGSRLSAADVLAVSNGLAAFGVEHPAAAITFQRGDRRDQLQLGGLTPIGGQQYAQVVGQPGLYAIPGDFHRLLPEGVNDWRDRALLRVAGRSFDRLEVRPSTNGFELLLNPTNANWQLVRPLPTMANTPKIRFLLQMLELARVSRFVADDPQTDLEAFGLQPPERELVVGRGTNELAVLQVGRSVPQDPTQVYVRRLPASNVVAVARTVVDPWLARFPDFCDHRLMIFPADDVDRIEVHADEDFAVRRVDTNDWQIIAPRAAPADRVLVLEMLAELKTMEFTDFERYVAADFAPYGLEPPRRQYTLRAVPTNAVAGPGGPILAQVSLGLPREAEFYARRLQESSVVRFLDPERLPRAAFELRDRRLWNISTNDIVSLTIQQLGEVRKLVRSPGGEWSVAAGSGTNVSNFTLEEAAWRIGQLRAERWVARGETQLPRFGFGTANHRVVLEIRAGDRTTSRVVRFGRTAASGRIFAAVELDGAAEPVIFECPAALSQFVQSELTLIPTRP